MLELMRAEMRQAIAWVAGQEASGEDDAAWDGADATDDVDGEWEEAQWEEDGVEVTEDDGGEKAPAVFCRRESPNQKRDARYSSRAPACDVKSKLISCTCNTEGQSATRAHAHEANLDWRT